MRYFVFPCARLLMAGIVVLSICIGLASRMAAAENIDGQGRNQGIGSSDLQILLNDNQLSLRAFLSPVKNITVGQKVTLTIEIATTRWFAGGTRIGPLDLHNVVVGPLSAFATNFSRREKGVSWTVQHWTRDVFLLNADPLTIPPIAVDITVAGEKGAVIKGRLFTQSLPVKASVPAEMQAVGQWLNAEDFSIETSFSSALTELQVGDVIEQTIISRAEGVPAMMLPPPIEITIAGLGRYQNPPVLTDETNRGVTRSKRRDLITYVIEKAGRYTLPKQEFLWWNNKLQRAEKINFPQREIYTVGTISEQASDEDVDATMSTGGQGVAVVMAAFAAVIFLLLSLSYFVKYNVWIQENIRQLKHRRQVITLWAAGDHTASMALFYHGIKDSAARDRIAPEQVQKFEQVLEKTYYSESAKMKILESDVSAKDLSRILFGTPILKKGSKNIASRSSEIRLN